MYIIHNYSSRQFFAILKYCSLLVKKFISKGWGKKIGGELEISRNRFFENRGKAFRMDKNDATSTKLAVWAGYILLSGVSRWVAGGFFIRCSRWIDKTRAFKTLPLSRHARTLFVFVASFDTRVYICICVCVWAPFLKGQFYEKTNVERWYVDRRLINY